MVVYEDHISFIMTDQHSHALLSEGFARNWNQDYFLGIEKKESVLFAIAQHDRGWIDIDESPIMNDKAEVPYSFNDFPISIKLYFYRKGIDEIEAQNQYAALLCSIHYTGFFEGMTDEHRINEYVKEEKVRQTRLLNTLNLHEADINMNFHYNLLKFCDNISLFLCMQEAGATDKDIHAWFKHGIEQPFHFFSTDAFMVEWKSEKEIIVNPFPFTGEFELSFPLRRVPKDLILEKGLSQAFHETSPQRRTVKIMSKIQKSC